MKTKIKVAELVDEVIRARPDMDERTVIFLKALGAVTDKENEEKEQ